MPFRLGYELYKKIDRLKNSFRCIQVCLMSQSWDNVHDHVLIIFNNSTGSH